jgi:hypothetical protein
MLSRKYRMILDLSFQLLVNGRRLKSVNVSSDKSLAKQDAMFEQGNVIPRIIWTMAPSKDTTTSFISSKVDLEDGYWRMAVDKADAWNLTYVLPGVGPHDPIQLVIPDALQMGWSESPPFFCAATKIARDIIATKCTTTECDQHRFLSLIEVYIDDFIGVIQSTTKAHLL